MADRNTAFEELTAMLGDGFEPSGALNVAKVSRGKRKRVLTFTFFSFVLSFLAPCTYTFPSSSLTSLSSYQLPLPSPRSFTLLVEE